MPYLSANPQMREMYYTLKSGSASKHRGKDKSPYPTKNIMDFSLSIFVHLDDVRRTVLAFSACHAHIAVNVCLEADEIITTGLWFCNQNANNMVI